MLRSLVTVVALVVFVGGTTVPFAAQRSMNVTTNTRGEVVTACDQIEVTFDRRSALTAEERQTIPRASVRTLVAQAARNGGVYVHGSERADYEVTLCKATAGSDVAFSDITLSSSNGVVTAKGPSRDGWISFLVIATPRNASLELTSSDGPVGLYGVSGTVKARTTNGPLSLKNCSGTIDVEADNGPISISGGAGSVRVRTQSGPLTVRLEGTSWSGDGLDARTHNGPLSLRLPIAYQGGVDLEMSSHSPFSCKGSICGQSRRGWDDQGRSLHLAGSPTRVRVTSVNGPVSVGTSR